MATVTEPGMDLEWLKRMDVHLRAAQEESDRLRRDHPALDSEFGSLGTVLLTMREEMDCAFVAYDPESMPDESAQQRGRERAVPNA